jgi:hypothetical protein
MLTTARIKRAIMAALAGVVVATLLAVNPSSAADPNFTITIKGSSVDGKGQPWKIWIFDVVKCGWAIRNELLSDKNSQTATLVARKGLGRYWSPRGSL